MDQVHGVARKQRQLHRAPLVNHLPQRGFGGIEQRRFGGHLNHFLVVADLQGEVELHLIGHADFDVILDELLEAGEFGGDGILAGDEVGQKIIAFGVGRGGESDAGFGVGRLNGGTGDG